MISDNTYIYAKIISSNFAVELDSYNFNYSVMVKFELRLITVYLIIKFVSKNLTVH